MLKSEFVYYFIHLNHQDFQTNSLGIPIHNYNKLFLRVFTTFGQNSAIVCEAYTDDHRFPPVKSYIILFRILLYYYYYYYYCLNIFTPFYKNFI
jgi:hypothetical protein